MGLFGTRKKAGKRAAPNQADPASSVWFEVIESANGSFRLRGESPLNTKGLRRKNGSTPKWKIDFPEFPYGLNETIALGYSGNFEYALIEEGDRRLACEAISVVKPILLSAYEISPEIPRYVMRKVYLSPRDDDPLSTNYLLMAIKPYTESGRNSKFPASIHAAFADAENRIEAKVFLLKDGVPGKVELILRSKSTWPMWSIYARLEEGQLVVNRIVRSDSNGDMPTLFTLGR